MLSRLRELWKLQKFHVTLQIFLNSTTNVFDFFFFLNVKASTISLLYEIWYTTEIIL